MASALPDEVLNFTSNLNVSPETLDKIALYGQLLSTWQKKINLVSPSTLPDMWRRHFLDSVQLFPLLPNGARHMIDLGSGAGFPGLVTAVLAADERASGGRQLENLHVTLVESDKRKSAFLREVARRLDISITLEAKRAEALSSKTYDVISARALASLDKLLILVAPFIGPQTRCFFLKGKGWQQEIEGLPRQDFVLQHHPSITSPEAAILEIFDFSSVAG